MSTAEEKRKERTEIRNAYLTGQKPKRVLVNAGFSWDAAISLAGFDRSKANYDMSLTEQAMEKICATIPSDTMMGSNIRFAYIFQLLGSRTFITASNGVLQHPEIVNMEVEDYDDFIRDINTTLIEKILPRSCTALNTNDPASFGLNLSVAYGAYRNIMAAQSAAAARVSAKHGFVQGFSTYQSWRAPFDVIGDLLRGFTGLSMDIRRRPEKVKAATEALVPLILKIVTPKTPRPGLCSFVALHLGSYFSEKVFAELYWPTFQKCVVELDKAGVAAHLFVEHDWTRYAEKYLSTLPKSTIMYMEYGDPKLFTETVGKDHIIGGFYDPTISLTRTKEECIDEAKRLLDITMKSGKYYFCFDKSVMDIKSIDISKVVAVLEWVTENAKY